MEKIKRAIKKLKESDDSFVYVSVDNEKYALVKLYEFQDMKEAQELLNEYDDFAPSDFEILSRFGT